MCHHHMRYTAIILYKHQTTITYTYLHLAMKKSPWLPLLLLIYLAIMCYIGRAEFYAGNYMFYFGIIGATLLCIILLHIFLKRGGTIGRRRRQS